MHYIYVITSLPLRSCHHAPVGTDASSVRPQVRLLVELGGASPSVLDRWSSTPLMEARRVQSHPVIQFLLPRTPHQVPSPAILPRPAAAHKSAHFKAENKSAHAKRPVSFQYQLSVDRVVSPRNGLVSGGTLRAATVVNWAQDDSPDTSGARHSSQEHGEYSATQGSAASGPHSSGASGGVAPITTAHGSAHSAGGSGDSSGIGGGGGSRGAGGRRRRGGGGHGHVSSGGGGS